MKNYSVRQLTFAAMVGALYAMLTLAIAPFGGAYSPVQCRVSEALCVLPFFFPEAKWGLFIGCIAANLISPSATCPPWSPVCCWPSPARSAFPTG